MGVLFILEHSKFYFFLPENLKDVRISMKNLDVFENYEGKFKLFLKKTLKF